MSLPEVRTVFVLLSDNGCGFCPQRRRQGHDSVQAEFFSWAPVNLTIAYEHAYASCRNSADTMQLQLCVACCHYIFQKPMLADMTGVVLFDEKLPSANQRTQCPTYDPTSCEL